MADGFIDFNPVAQIINQAQAGARAGGGQRSVFTPPQPPPPGDFGPPAVTVNADGTLKRTALWDISNWDEAYWG